MVSIKKIFGSGTDTAGADDGGDLRHRNSRTSLDRSGKEGEAKSKNDELAARLTGKSSTEGIGHRNSQSGSSTTGYNTENTNNNNSSSHNTGVANTGSSTLGSSGVNTSNLSESTPHGAFGADGRPIVGAVPIHAGKDAQSTNNPSFVLPNAPAGAPSGLNSSIPATGLGHVGSEKRDNSNVESFTEAHRDLDNRTDNRASIGSTAPTTTSSTTGTHHDSSDRTGMGRLSKSSSGRGFDQPHETGHLASKTLHEFDPKLATHDHQHLQHVTHREVRHVEVEEVERQREVDRHIHHVQTHIQPVVDKKVLPEQIRENIIAPTKVHERHASTAEDVKLFESLATQHRDTEVVKPKERTVVDLGEKVVEKIHHHVHHVTQPVIEQEIVERHRIHTVIPVHHVTHEAPIIHKSSVHAPVSLDDFVKGGGKLDSKVTYNNVGLLPEEECERSVDGVAEQLVRDLNLKTDNKHYSGSSTSHGLGSSTGTSTGLGHANHDHSSHSTTGTSNDGKYISKDGDAHGSKIGQVVDNMTPSAGRIGSTDKI